MIHDAVPTSFRDTPRLCTSAHGTGRRVPERRKKGIEKFQSRGASCFLSEAVGTGREFNNRRDIIKIYSGQYVFSESFRPSRTPPSAVPDVEHEGSEGSLAPARYVQLFRFFMKLVVLA